MTQFLMFAFYLCLSALLLIVVPVLMHPTLPSRRKALIISITFVVIVPGGLALYGFLGAPMMISSGH